MEKTQREIAEEWFRFSIENWRKKLTLRQIKNTGQLFESFKGNVIDSAGGDRLKLELAYSWYGMMVDMGVGRGTKAFDVRDRAMERRLLGKKGTTGGGRRQKRWFRTRDRDSIEYQVHRLSVLMGESILNTAMKKDMFGGNQIFVINF